MGARGVDATRRGAKREKPLADKKVMGVNRGLKWGLISDSDGSEATKPEFKRAFLHFRGPLAGALGADHTGGRVG